MSRAALETLARVLDDPGVRDTLGEYFKGQQDYHTLHSQRFITSVPPRIEPAIQSAAKAEEYEHLLGSLDRWVRDYISKGE